MQFTANAMEQVQQLYQPMFKAVSIVKGSLQSALLCDCRFPRCAVLIQHNCLQCAQKLCEQRP